MARQCLHEKSVFIGQFEQKKIAVFTTIFSDFPFRDFRSPFFRITRSPFLEFPAPFLGISGPRSALSASLFGPPCRSSLLPLRPLTGPLPAPYRPLTGPSGDYLEGWAAGASAAGVSAGASVVDSAAGISACGIAAGASVSSTRS